MKQTLKTAGSLFASWQTQPSEWTISEILWPLNDDSKCHVMKENYAATVDLFYLKRDYN